MKRRTKILLSVLALFCVYVAYSMYRSSGVAYIEKVSGIDVPWPREVTEHRSIDWAYATYIRMSPEQAEELKASVHFGECHEDPRRIDPSIEYLFGGDGAGEPFPDISTVLVHKGVGDYNTWSFYLNAKTGQLWIMVYHADLSGDLPGGALKHPQNLE